MDYKDVAEQVWEAIVEYYDDGPDAPWRGAAYPEEVACEAVAEAANAILGAVVALAAQLPSGLSDRKAPQKLEGECQELEEALGNNDYVAALTEVADVVYDAIKAIEWAAASVGLTVGQALVLAIAKYRLRARPGNPKDDVAERAACAEVMSGVVECPHGEHPAFCVECNQWAALPPGVEPE